MPIGDDIALAVNDHSRTQRMFANRALVLLPTEKAVEEIYENESSEFDFEKLIVI